MDAADGQLDPRPRPPGSTEVAFRRHSEGSLGPASRLAATFLILILIGTVLLSLPAARLPGHDLDRVDALFMATSATCLTGLASVNVAESFTPFGQSVLLVLIQLGGLGITTAGTLFILWRRGGGSLAGEDFIVANVGRLREARPTDVFIYSCFVVLTLELLGTVTLTHLLLSGDSEASFRDAVWQAAFHSVSAFCNAGLTLHPDGLVHWRHRPGILLVISLLVFLGSIGLLTLVNFRYYYPWRRDRLQRGRLTLQTRLCIGVSLALLLLGTILTLLSESDQTLEGQPWPQAVLWSFVHSTMTRSGGFNVVDTGAMAPETLLGSLALMFVGGAPGSMAGGIKVTTLVLLAAVAWASLRRRSDLVVGRHTIPPDQAANAVMVTLLSALAVVLAVGLLMNIESAHASPENPIDWLAIAFEAVSALATVGLSTGITPDLAPASKAIVVVLMFVGRLGPLCLAMHLARPAHPHRVTFPRENIIVG
ncbi:MAG: hypothetical protein KF833_11610 [Verrucomicrobiae bacterium]|nr:hypothetical protein [Verrucomicrobiae bacterium]